MIEMAEIRSLVKSIVHEFDPERVVLFGSYGYGTPTSDSDVDLLVIMPFEGKSYYKSAEILQKVNPRFSVDLLVRTPQQLRRRISLGDFFLREITEKGKCLYERNGQRVGRKSRR
jgi:predicted nucleotidyltransferase